ncbi:hypothetical protein BI291_13315 [Thalassotalea sp. PP2-459]|nr:hypothetical protein BI291_13315 [Thalassotalea sp. PP2-459]
MKQIQAWWFRSNLYKRMQNAKYFLLPSLFNKKPCIEVYVALKDPHSYMLIQALIHIEQRYEVDITLYLVYESLPGINVYPKLMRQWVLTDANVIAHRYGLKAITVAPNDSQLLTGQQYWQLSVKNVVDAEKLFTTTWQGSFEYYCQTSTPVINFQIKNQRRLVNKGHYLAATCFFAGEWFLGVDRLKYLEQRLLSLGLIKKDSEPYFQHEFNDEHFTDLTVPIIKDRTVDVYLSLNCPYSYIGFVKAVRLATKHQLTLSIKPIIPIEKRGFKIPVNKQKYMYSDAYREAKAADIAFSNTITWFDQHVVCCYQIFSYAAAQGKAIDYVSAVFNALFVESINLNDEHAMKRMCQQLQIDHAEALAYQQQHDWQVWAEQHVKELAELGLWGTPCFRYQSTSCWGQDRFFLIEQAISQPPEVNSEYSEEGYPVKVNVNRL